MYILILKKEFLLGLTYYTKLYLAVEIILKIFDRARIKLSIIQSSKCSSCILLQLNKIIYFDLRKQTVTRFAKLFHRIFNVLFRASGTIC